MTLENVRAQLAITIEFPHYQIAVVVAALYFLHYTGFVFYKSNITRILCWIQVQYQGSQ